MRILTSLLLTLLLAASAVQRSEAKGYSSGGGHSYSSHSSSHTSRSSGSSSRSSSHSFSSGSHSSSSRSTTSSRPASSPASSGSKSSGSSSTHSSSGTHSTTPSTTRSTSSDQGTTKTYHSGSGKSYSSGSTWNDDSRRSYSSGKSYSSPLPPATYEPPRRSQPDSVSSTFTFDSAAGRARKEETSQKEFTRFKESQVPKPRASEPAPTYAVKPPPVPNTVVTPEPAPSTPPVPSYRVQPPPIPRTERQVYIPDTEVVVTRPVRRHTVFYPYESRPVVIYRDSYSSLFWWWLMDRSLEDRAQWTYHHRYDMDPDRYQNLLAENRELETRVQQLEAQQVARDPNYVPPGLDRDLMYSDRSVEHAYSNRPTTAGRIAFGVFAIPALLAFICFFIWFIFIKRWPSTSTT